MKEETVKTTILLLLLIIYISTAVFIETNKELLIYIAGTLSGVGITITGLKK